MIPQVSERRVCRLLEVPRSATAERSPCSTSAPKLDDMLVTRLEELIQAHLTYGLPEALGTAPLAGRPRGQPEAVNAG